MQPSGAVPGVQTGGHPGEANPYPTQAQAEEQGRHPPGPSASDAGPAGLRPSSQGEGHSHPLRRRWGIQVK